MHFLCVIMANLKSVYACEYHWQRSSVKHVVGENYDMRVAPAGSKCALCDVRAVFELVAIA